MDKIATVYMDRQGAGFHFQGKSYDDWRELPDDLDDLDEDGVDILRATRFIADLESLPIEFVIDFEHYGSEEPVTIAQYLGDMKAYLAEISE